MRQLMAVAAAAAAWTMPYVAHAQSAPAYPGYPPPAVAVSPDEEPPARHLGVGYKIGNGLGFMGADVIVRPIEHVSVDLQLNYANASTTGAANATGWGVVPEVQLELRPRRSTPYLGLGLWYARIGDGTVTASGSGFVVNGGWQWRWSSGVEILLGAGMAHIGDIRATNGVDTVEGKGGNVFNIEAGVRYLFL